MPENELPKIDDMTDDEIDTILANIMTGKDGEPIIEIINPEQFFATFLTPNIPTILQERLDTLQFTGDFSTLNITVQEALAMDLPTLARHINEVTGIAKQCAEQREQENQERNKKWMNERANKNRFG